MSYSRKKNSAGESHSRALWGSFLSSKREASTKFMIWDRDKMKVLVIGGTGFISYFVVEELLSRGHEVTIFHRGEHEAEHSQEVRHIHGNRKELLRYKNLLLDENFDAVADIIPMNDEDSKQVIEVFRGAIKASVHISSMDVYRAWGAVQEDGVSDPVPIPEEAPLREQFYLYHGKLPGFENYEKILMERVVMQACRDGGFPAAILRLPMVYGPRDPQAREWPIIKRVLDRRKRMPMGGGSCWLCQRAYVEDVAKAVVLALESEQAVGEIFNVGEDRVLTMKQWAEAVAAVMGAELEVVIVPDERLPQHLGLYKTHQQHIVGDTSKIRQKLGYCEAYLMTERLRRSVDWHIQHPPREYRQDTFDYEAEDRALAPDKS